MSDLAIIVQAVKKKHPCDPVHAAIDRTVKLIQEFADSNKALESKVKELEGLVQDDGTNGLKIDAYALHSENKRLKEENERLEMERTNILEVMFPNLRFVKPDGQNNDLPSRER